MDRKVSPVNQGPQVLQALKAKPEPMASRDSAPTKYGWDWAMKAQKRILSLTYQAVRPFLPHLMVYSIANPTERHLP